MMMRQRGWIPSADRAHRPADIALLDTMHIVVDIPLVIRFPALAAHHSATLARRARALRPAIAGAVCARPGSLTSDVVSLEVTT